MISRLPTSSPAVAAAPQDIESAPNPSNSFAERIRLLIQRVGSATEIARMCGFSEGVVRSWRDGNSDPSRARCVTLARTLGISLVWLVAGEGAIQAEAIGNATEEQTKTEVQRSSRNHREYTVAGTHYVGVEASQQGDVDTRRLEAARRLLKSNLALAGTTPSPAEQEQMLATLYDIVGPEGTRIDADALLAFQLGLAERRKAELQIG
jgi:transcriptional regulator with XRE-family HTH domain